MRARVHLPLPGLLAILLLACGRTGSVRRSQPDANPDQGQDACCTGDLTASDLAGGRTCAVLQGSSTWPVVELVVDTSISMQDAVTGTGQSGWELTRDTLKRVISRLTSASPAMGLTLFPNRGDCVSAPIAVPAAPISAQTQAQLIAALDSVASPMGARPTAAALASPTVADLADRGHTRSVAGVRCFWGSHLGVAGPGQGGLASEGAYLRFCLAGRWSSARQAHRRRESGSGCHT